MMSNDLAYAISTNIIKDDDSTAGVGTAFLVLSAGGPFELWCYSGTGICSQWLLATGNEW